MSDNHSDAKILWGALRDAGFAIQPYAEAQNKTPHAVAAIGRIAAEFSRPYRERIAELEAEHALSWNAFEKEALTAIGPEIIGSTVDAGSDIPGMIQRLHDRYRAEIQRGDAQRAAMAEQLETYKRLANMKRTTKRDA